MEAITETEVTRAVSKLKNGKAAGTDHIQPDLLKHAETVIPQLTKLCNTVWQSKEVSTQWENGMIVPIPKKSDLAYCNNWRGITLCCQSQAKCLLVYCWEGYA